MKRRALDEILNAGIVPVVRTTSADAALFVTSALVAAGIAVVEITLTIPLALEVIASVRRRHPALLVGAGSVLDTTMARSSLDAGAEFLVSPGLDSDILSYARTRKVLAAPGVLTPSEVLSARRAGAELFKVFPCSLVGGAGYLKALRAPLPDLAFMPTGGVTVDKVSDYVRAGAAAIGAGSELIDPGAVERRDEHAISERAQQFLRALAQTRAVHDVTPANERRSHA
jgi:2-dehydro-3-deoxyphosphogluconate aldolase / (4S)-4-hydroxy-2-oxoglutarate aldolase